MIGIQSRTYNRKSTAGSRTFLTAAAILVVGVCLFSQTRISAGERTARRWDELQKIEPALALVETDARSGGDSIPVLIQFADEEAGAGRGRAEEGFDREARASERTRQVYEAGAVPERSFTHVPVVSARVQQGALRYLASDPRVTRISLDHKVQGSLSTTARAIGADLAWSGVIGQHGVTGSGVTVAVLDSGVEDYGDLDHRVKKSISFVPEDTHDKYGHGTHVGGIIAADGSDSRPGRSYDNQYKGIAPSAKIISLKVLQHDGAGRTSDVLAALAWCLDNRATYKIRIINISLGHPVYESYKTDPLCLMVERCVRSGMVVVAAAGNCGKGSEGTTVYGGINSPANDPAVITVGAIYTHGTAYRSDDTIASYSSRGPTAIDGLIKPDIVAPGNTLVSVAAEDSELFKRYPANRVQRSDGRPGEDYFVLSGTSMAAPVVSGTVALMLEANPSLTPNAVRAVLAYTAERMTTPHILDQGNGYLNAEGAVRLAFAISQDSGSIAAGLPWIANPESVQPFSIIQGEAVAWGDAVLWGDAALWGDAVIWGDAVLWGDGALWGDAIRRGVLWGDNLMITKQPAYGSAVLWGESTLDPSGSTVGANWGPDVRVGYKAIRRGTESRWYPLFADPRSLTDTEDVLGNGEFWALPPIVVGPPGAWFYPPQ